MKKSEFTKDIRVCVVDNYQGEESDIIILSMVPLLSPQDAKDREVGR